MVLGLGHLGELLGVAEEDEARRRQPRRRRARERELARLVDEQEVEVLAVIGSRKQPRRPCHQLMILGHVAVVRGRLDQSVGALIVIALVDRREARAHLGRVLLDIAEHVLNRGMALGGDAYA